MAHAAARNAVAKVVRNERRSRGLNRVQFSKLLGVSPSAVRQWEIATSLPGVRYYLRFKNILGVDLKKIIEENKK